MIIKFALAIDLLLLAYGAYKMGMSALYDFDDEESFLIGARCLITAVCAFAVICAVGLMFAGGAE